MPPSATALRLKRETGPSGGLRREVRIGTRRKADGGPTIIDISTEAVDRVRDVLYVDGWDLKDYKTNPQILWMHDRFSPPIGNAEDVYVEDSKLRAIPKWVPADAYPFGAMIGKLVDLNFVRAASVGFTPDPEKTTWNDARGGFDFRGQRLDEFSMVTIPCNPEALVAAKAMGVDLTAGAEWAERTLDLKLRGTDFAEALLRAARPDLIAKAFAKRKAVRDLVGIKADPISVAPGTTVMVTLPAVFLGVPDDAEGPGDPDAPDEGTPGEAAAPEPESKAFAELRELTKLINEQ